MIQEITKNSTCAGTEGMAPDTVFGWDWVEKEEEDTVERESFPAREGTQKAARGKEAISKASQASACMLRARIRRRR